MSTPFLRLLAPIVTLRAGERASALLMFAYSFLAMTAYNIVKPVTRSKFISDLGADNLPYVLLLAAIGIGVVMEYYGRGVGRLPRRSVIPVTQAGLVVVLLAFWALFTAGVEWVSAAFYLFGLILGILLISQFWTLASEIYDPRQAKRLFGFIGGGASLGGMTGAGLTAILVDTLGTTNLLLASAAVLGLCMLTVAHLVRWAPRGERGGRSLREEAGVAGGKAVRLLAESTHLKIIALVVGLAAMGAAIIEQQLNMAAEQFKGQDATDAITGFLAQVTLYVSAIGFVIQIALTSRIHRFLGIGVALMVLPVSLGGTAVLILINGALWAPAVARAVDTSLRYTLDKTTREVLFLPLPVALKYQAKPFVDVTVDRFAKGVAAVALLLLIKVMDFGWQELSYATLAVTGLWIVVALRAKAEYRTAFRRSIEQQQVQPGEVELHVPDLAAVEALVQELAHPDDRRVLYAIELLEAFDKARLVTPLLLQHGSPQVRTRALVALESARDDIAEHWRPMVERMVQDDSADVRAAAVRALAAIRREEPPALMRTYLAHPDPRVAVTAAVSLANTGRPEDVAAAEGTLMGLIADPREEAAAGRREVAGALARVTNPAVQRLAIPLMLDGDPAIAAIVLRSVRRFERVEPLFVPVLVSLLRHRLLKTEARDVLVSYGDEVLEALAHFLRDPAEDLWVRRHIPATVARIPRPRSIEILLAVVDDADGFLRYKAVEGLERLRREHPDLSVDSDPILQLVQKEAARYFTYLTLRHDLSRGVENDGADWLVNRAIGEKLQRTRDRIFRLLGLLYPSRDVADARWALENGPASLRASAAEFLDNLMTGPTRRLVLPIIEDLPLDERVRAARTLVQPPDRDAIGALSTCIADTDPVVAAAAVHCAGERHLQALAPDLERARAHGGQHRDVVEAATWALAAVRTPKEARRAAPGEPLPVVEAVAKLARIPLFTFVSVAELFRFVCAGRPIEYDAGRSLYEAGRHGDRFQFLLQGRVTLAGPGGDEQPVDAPSALAFEELLEGCPIRHSVRTVERAIALALTTDEFFGVLAENASLAQGLFRMVFDNPVLAGWQGVMSPADPDRRVVSDAPERLGPLDHVLLLQHIPLFRRAAPAQVLDIAAVTRHVAFAAGERLFDEGDPAAICLVLAGRISFEQPGGTTRDIAEPGDVIGLYETLVGVPAGRRAESTEAGAALLLQRDDLFDLLAAQMDLLRGLFAALCTARRVPRPAEPEPVRTAESNRS